jgi:cytochrome c-type biogenesis protein CcmH/NrfG
MNHKCIKCGIDIPVEMKFCPECGTAQRSKKVAKDKKSETPKQDKGTKPFSGRNLLYIVALLSIVVVGIYGYRYFIPPDRTANPHVHSENTEPQPRQPVFDQDTYNQLQSRLAANPDGFEENVDMGNFLFDSGRFEQAITYYQKALSIRSDVADVIVDIGVSHFNIQQYEKARAYFEQALQVNPEHPNALYNLGVVSAQTGNMSAMMDSWERLIEVAPESAPAQTAKRMIEQVRQSDPANNQ